MPAIEKEEPINIDKRNRFNKKYFIFIFAIILIVIVFLILNNQTKTEIIENTECYIEVERVVDGISMEPLLSNGQEVISQENFYDCNNIERGDIVAFHFKTREEDFIKTIVGVPGDTIKIDNSGYLLINGKKVENSIGENYKMESRAKVLLITPLTDENKIAKNGYLVLGDDISSDSFDSRQFGYIDNDHIISKIKY